MAQETSRPGAESVLIVGATGNIGTELVKQFADSGKRVKALVRNESKAAAIRHLAEPVFGDLMAPATLASAFKNVERVFVLAPPIAEAEETMERNAFNAAVEAGAKRIVYLSSYGVAFGDDRYPHTVHAANEKVPASLNVDWTVLRPARFMSYLPFVWNSILRRGLLLEQAGDGAMTTIDPVDVAAVGLLALTTGGHEGQTYELTSEDSFSTRQLGERLSKVLNKRLTVFDGSTEELRAELIENGAPGAYASIMSHYFESVADGRWKVTDTVGQVLGRKPRSYAQWLDQSYPAFSPDEPRKLRITRKHLWRAHFRMTQTRPIPQVEPSW
jgi:uncharacterized protein YbjT (DUF2867 family)